VAGLGKQGKRKAAKRAVDLSVLPKAKPKWSPPPPEERYTQPQVTIPPPDASVAQNRIIVRMDSHTVSDQIIEFAVIQQTKYKGTWRTVCVADSCHNDEVHLHQHGRSTDDRIGEPEQISEIHELKDVGSGYDQAYDRVFDSWTENLARWRDG
jgi:hypothetical protein